MFVPFELLSWAGRSSALWFLGSHSVDALRFVLGAEVKRVQAVVRRGFLAGHGVDTADVHIALLEFDNGVVASLENSWVLPRDLPLVFDFKLEIVGEKGALQVDTAQNGTFKKYAGEGLRTADMLGVTPAAGGRIGGFVMESIARFVDSVTTGAPVLADARDGLQVTRVLAAIEQAAESGNGSHARHRNRLSRAAIDRGRIEREAHGVQSRRPARSDRAPAIRDPARLVFAVPRFFGEDLPSRRPAPEPFTVSSKR